MGDYCIQSWKITRPDEKWELTFRPDEKWELTFDKRDKNQNVRQLNKFKTLSWAKKVLRIFVDEP